jgi:prephenate dehydrogenase
MFGPGIRSLRKQPVLVVPSAYTDSVAETFLSILKRKGAQIVPIDFDSHDRYVAATLALPHFANIVFANVLRSLKIDPNRLRELAGTTFKLQLLCAEAVCHEPLDNESSILMDNPESARVLSRFYHQSEAIMSIVKNGTGKRLARELMRSRDFLRKDKEFARAYAQFNAAANVAGLT